MTSSIHKILFTAAFGLAFSQAALAGTQAISCDGCSENTMQQAAAGMGTQGIVYVFNAEDRKVNTYRLVTEGLDLQSNTWELQPFTTFTTAWKLRTDPALSKRWNDYLRALDEVGTPGGDTPITLPPDFPVRSVAGALVDPVMATTAIEDYLLSLPEQHQLALSLSALVSKALDLKLPLVDLRSLIQETTVTVQFPDGSTMDFSVHFTADQMSLAARTELTPEGNAHTDDGQAAPTSGLGFRGRSFNDDYGALIEWITLARSFGLRVSGSGTRMECAVAGSHIRCVVIGK